MGIHCSSNKLRQLRHSWSALARGTPIRGPFTDGVALPCHWPTISWELRTRLLVHNQCWDFYHLFVRNTIQFRFTSPSSSSSWGKGTAGLSVLSPHPHLRYRSMRSCRACQLKVETRVDGQVSTRDEWRRRYTFGIKGKWSPQWQMAWVLLRQGSPMKGRLDIIVAKE